MVQECSRSRRGSRCVTKTFISKRLAKQATSTTEESPWKSRNDSFETNKESKRENSEEKTQNKVGNCESESCRMSRVRGSGESEVEETMQFWVKRLGCRSEERVMILGWGSGLLSALLGAK